MILTQDALRADTIVYAVTHGSGVIGTMNLNTGVFTQIAAPGLSLSSVYGFGETGGTGALTSLLSQWFVT